MNYTPDNWVILRITSKEFGTLDKVFCSWGGGYCGSDQWKMSSGIVSYDHFDSRVEFLNESGSNYICYKNSEGMSGYMKEKLDYFRTNLPDGQFDVVSFSDYIKEK